MNNLNKNDVSILLVEDDDIDAMTVERAIKRLNLANPYIRVKDGVEGLALLRNEGVFRPFIILLDLNLPRMGGLEMLSELRSDPKLTDCVVFVLTTSNDDQDRAAAYKEHIAGYIVKSRLDGDFNELLQLLEQYWRLVELPIKHH
jgi:CheY-like chemotaxis protein